MARQPYIAPSVAVFAALAILSVSAFAFAAGTESPTRDETRKILRELPDGVHPLYVLGDLNEDGKVDREDLRILSEFVDAQRTNGFAPGGLTCIAAGDVNRDGNVDSADIGMLKDWLARAPELPAPALYWSSQLPCSYSHLMVASKVQSHPGEVVAVLVVGKGVDPAKTELRIHSGPATVTRAGGGRGFDVKVAATATSSDYIVLKLTVPDRRDYYYQLPVVKKSYQGEPPMPASITR